MAYPQYIHGPSIQVDLLNTALKAREAHVSTPTVVTEYSSFEDIKTTLTTKSAYEARHSQLDSRSI